MDDELDEKRLAEDELEEQLVAELLAWAEDRGYAPQEHNYGRDRDQVADLTVPPTPGRCPVAVLVHGGFWRAPFDRSVMNALAAAFAERGWATWNVEYRRGPGSGGDGRAIADVRAALSMLRLIPEPLDLKRLVVIGHSAGGHLALCCAGAARASRVVSLGGVADLLSAAAEGIGAGAALEFMGTTAAQSPAAYAAADPMAMLPSGLSTLLVHGDADDTVPIDQSRRYLTAARAVGDDCELLELPGEGHMSLIDPRSEAFGAWVQRLAL